MDATNVLILNRDRCSDREFQPLEPQYMDSFEQILSALKERDRDSLWLAVHREFMTLICRALALLPASSEGPTLWLRFRASAKQLGTLSAGFSRVVPNPKAALVGHELAEVLHADHPEDHVVAAHYHSKEGQLTLWRGDFSTLVVSVSSLRKRVSRRFNPRRLSITDYGQTLAFGDYEVSVDSILYERDPAFRRRANARRRDLDTSFGGCLRRLRVLRGVGRDEFPGLSEKTIARIERGEVERPHKRTLQTIAEVLGVQPDDIETY